MPDGFELPGVLVFDGSDFLENATVVVEGSLIAGVTAGGTGGRTDLCVLPGIIDSHVHIGLHDPSTVLRGGVTTARDLGWPPDEIFGLRDRLETSFTEGPQLLATGQMLTAPDGYPTKAAWAPRGTGRPVTDDDDAREAVREMASRGASSIKIAQEPRQGPVLGVDTVRAIVAQAHELGLRVTSHVGSLGELDVALAAGVDELAHGLWSDEQIPASTVEAMVAGGMVVVPTLHIDPTPQRIASTRTFVEAGGTVVYGTDMGNVGPPPGIDVQELTLMLRCGLDLTQVLASATSAAAAHLAISGTGLIAEGSPADLVVVRGDPREDLSVLSAPERVVRAGRTASS